MAVGELVWSFNEKIGLPELKPVVATFVKKDITVLYKLSIGNEIIFATSEHPFFIQGEWVEAQYLTVGDSISFFNHGYDYVLIEKEKIDTLVDVYNFHVLENHNYFVSSMGVLVHNNSIPTGPNISKLRKVTDPNEIPFGCEKVADNVVKDLGKGGKYLEIRSTYGNIKVNGILGNGSTMLLA